MSHKSQWIVLVFGSTVAGDMTQEKTMTEPSKVSQILQVLQMMSCAMATLRLSILWW